MEFMRGQRMYHALDATHPDTATRIAKAYAMSSLLVSEGGALEVKADIYKDQLDRMMYGEAKERLRLTVYTVKEGDSLASIAQQELRDEGKQYEIGSLNGLPERAVLTPGMRLKLVVKQGEINKRQELHLQKD
jgi:predicted Zn-dependent protease